MKTIIFCTMLLFPFVTFSQVESVREFSVKIPLGELDVVSDSNSDDVETKAVELEVKLFYTEEGEELDSRIYQQISDEINEGGSAVNRQFFNIADGEEEKKLLDKIAKKNFSQREFSTFHYDSEYLVKKLNTRAPDAFGLGRKVLASLRTWYSNNKARVNSAIIRTTIGGTIAHMSYIQGGLSAEHALNLSIFMGVFNFIDQFYTEDMNDFLTTNIFQSKFKALLGKKIAVKASTLPNVFKRYLVKELFIASMLEAAFLAITEMGKIEITPDLLLHSGIVVSTGALFSVLTQGVMDTSLAMEFTQKMERLEDLLQREDITAERKASLMRRLSKYEKIVNYGGMGTTLTWLAAATTGTMGLSVSHFIYIGLGIGGVANHVRLDLHKESSVIKKYLLAVKKACSLNLHLIE